MFKNFWRKIWRNIRNDFCRCRTYTLVKSWKTDEIVLANMFSNFKTSGIVKVGYCTRCGKPTGQFITPAGAYSIPNPSYYLES